MDRDIIFPVGREEFEDQITDLLARIPAPIERALELAEITKEDLSEVQILGGGSRVPAVYSMLEKVFKQKPGKSLNLDECFAIGSGYMAAFMSPVMHVPLDIKDVIPYAITASWDDQTVEVFKQFHVIPAAEKITVEVNKECIVTLSSNSEEMGYVKIITDVSDPVTVALPLKLSQSGTIVVGHALVEHTDKLRTATVQTLFVGDLPDETIASFQELEHEFEENDILELEIDTTRNELEGLIFKSESDATHDLAPYMSKDEYEEFRVLLRNIKSWFEENEFERLQPEEYVKRSEAIKEAVESIYERKDEWKAVDEELAILRSEVMECGEVLLKDVAHARMPEYIALQEDIRKFVDRYRLFADHPRFEPPPIPLNELKEDHKYVDQLRARIDEIAKIQPFRM